MGEPSPASRGKSAQRQLADGDANEAQDTKPTALAHFADLAVSSLVKPHFKQGLVLLWVIGQNGGLHGEDLIAVERHGGAQMRQLRRPDLSAHGHAIDLGDLVTGMGESMGQLSVIGQEKQSLRVHVESADGIDPPSHGLGQVSDRAPSAVVGKGGYVSSRLVEKNADPLFAREADHLAPIFHDVGGGIDAVAEGVKILHIKWV